MSFTNRFKARLALCVVLSLIASSFASAQTPVLISDIIVLGNKQLNRESIVATSGLKVGDTFSEKALEDARARLLRSGNFGQTGVPEDSVKISAEIDQANHKAKVVITVVENDLIKGIVITGTGPVPVDQIRKLMKTAEGNVLNIPVLQRDVTAIRNYYEEKGYQAFVSDKLAILDGILTVPVVVGQIEHLKIVGLHKTRSFVITREMQQKPGQYYNLLQLRKDLTKIYNTDLFENLEPAFSFPEAGKVDITLNVTEKRTGTVELAVGYGTQGLVGRAGIIENNFMGRGQQTSFTWETGGFAGRNSFEVSFTEPWLDKKNTSLSVNLFDKTVYRFNQRIGSVINTNTTDQTSNIYYETHEGGQVTVSRPFGRAFRGFVGFRYDNVKVPFLELSGADQAVLQNGPLETVNLRATHNTRDFDLEPATGGYEIYTGDIGRANLHPVTFAQTGLFGQLNYTRLGIDARRYFSPQGRRLTPKDKRTVIALRLMLGTSTGTLPFSEQYFVGGAESLRGYNEDRFWGKNMFLGSVELRHPLASSLTGVLFTDVGDAWGGVYQNVRLNGFDQHGGFNPSLGIGVGLRVITPIGPIRIDEGFGREGARTHFSIGHVF